MFFSSKNGKLCVMIDVQSSIVRGSLVHMRKDNIPLILFTHNVEVPFRIDSGSEYLVKMIQKGVSEIITQILKNIHIRSSVEEIPKKISEIHYILSSPWIVSQARTLTISFEKSTSVDRPYILDLIAKERAKFIPDKNNNIRVVEEKVFDVRLNGYSVSSWNDQEAKNLEISFVFSAAGKKIIENLMKACEHAVSTNKILFHSSLFLQHISTQKILRDVSSCGLLHIHGELTDILIIRDQACTFLGSYPFGIGTVIRNMSTDLKVDEKSAESILSMITENHLDNSHAKAEAVNVEKMKVAWMLGFQKLVESSPEKILLPNNFIISAHSHEDIFTAIFSKTYPTTTLHVLNLEEILPHVEYDSHAERLRLTGLYASAIHSLEQS